MLNDIFMKYVEVVGVNIKWGKKVVVYEEMVELVIVFCEDGEKMQVDILVGFDGIYFVICDKML